MLAYSKSPLPPSRQEYFRNKSPKVFLFNRSSRGARDSSGSKGIIGWQQESTKSKGKIGRLQCLDLQESIRYISLRDELYEATYNDPERLPLLLAVSQNEVSQTYTIWSVKYVIHSSEVGSKPQEALGISGNALRRRSSYAPSMSTGVATPMVRKASNGRDSLATGRSKAGQSRDVLSDSSFDENRNDLMSHLDSALGNGNGRAGNSRRVSSLLARADLSSYQDRKSFGDLVGAHPESNTGLRDTLFGQNNAKLSSSFSNGISHSRSKRSREIRSSTEPSSIDESRFDSMLENSDGDQSDVNTDGLSVGNEPGLRSELLMEKIHVFSYDDLKRPHDEQPLNTSTHPKVFVLKPPRRITDLKAGISRCFLCLLHQGAGSLTTMSLEVRFASAASCHAKGSVRAQEGIRPPQPEIRVAEISQQSSPRDACKISTSECSRLLVLKVDTGAISTLSLQAPWSSSFDIELPKTFSVYNPFRIANNIPSTQRREGGFKRVLSRGPQSLVGLAHSDHRGRADVIDSEGFQHRLEIQLLPHSDLVRKMILLGDSILPSLGGTGDQILNLWWSALSWLRPGQKDEVDLEWTSFGVCLFSIVVGFVADRRSETTNRQQKRKTRLLRSSSGANTNLESWDTMLIEESEPCGAWPDWMKMEAWNWAVTNKSGSFQSHPEITRKTAPLRTAGFVHRDMLPTQKKSLYLVNCLSLARDFKHSIHASKSPKPSLLMVEGSIKSVRMTIGTLLIGYHLLREEMKLNSLSSGSLHMVTPILAQLGSWLGWSSWSFKDHSYYMLESTEMHFQMFNDSALSRSEKSEEPFPPPSILQFIEDVTVKAAFRPFITLFDLIGSQDAQNKYRTFIAWWTHI